MSGFAPEVIADPVGVVVEWVTRRDSSLDASLVAGIVEEVAGGRAKRRRLAQAVLDRPQVLGDGRSPAPRVVADMLVELKKAGAEAISAPICTECGRPARTVKRRDQDWYCHTCFVRRYTAQDCAGCGHRRRVHHRDHNNRPLCKACPPDPRRNPVGVITVTVIAVDPALPVAAVMSAVKSVVPRAGQRWPLAWAIEDRPELLTGAGADAPVPAVLRLIDRLCDMGSAIIVRPACPGCGRTVALYRRIGGQWLCCTCVARACARPCGRCGITRATARRDGSGRPICSSCSVRDPINHEVCVGCRRLRPVNTRTADGPLCRACVPSRVAECSICGRTATCTTSAATGRPWCRVCKSRRARCSGCGRSRPVRGGTSEAPRCAACTRDEPEFWRSCPTCGEPGQVLATVCTRCRVDHRLQELLGDEHRHIPPHLQPLRQALIHPERAATVEQWLRRSNAPDLLRALRHNPDPLSHDSLDDLPPGKTLDHLRSLLVATGVLPQRDEHMTRLERWTSTIISARTDPDERKLLHRYAHWHLIRRLRHRTRSRITSQGQATAAQENIRSAVALLDWLNETGRSLATATHADLDAWQTTYRTNAGNFVRVDLPEPLASLIRKLVETRRNHATISGLHTTIWLFPGARPGRPLSAKRLTERLNNLGIRTGTARGTALFQLTTELPAAIVARMLGIHINVATAWQQASSGDWMTYAADISRR
ncbi:hypothetical protein [Nocardia wallacei]|uniref:hypothetical protein n=2 Tax=Nocardia wallacei TaxID=480035 RepID=UPI002455E27C|nr:hypothetical protein [Nocardia wallacei]